MDFFIGLDDDAPPVKRLKLDHVDMNNNNMGLELGLSRSHPNERKRKIAVKRPIAKDILDLNEHVILETFKYLPLNG